MKLFRNRRYRRLSLLLCLAVLSLVFAPVFNAPASAGKEGVFLSPTVYFTLEEASLSQGTDTQTMRFAVQLVNGSSSTVDFNQYGARVVDDKGNRYSAALTERSTARVLPGQSQLYRYSADVPASLTADELKVDLFAWNGGAMTDIGALSVEPAIASVAVTSHKAVIDLTDLDTAYPVGSNVTFELLRSYKATGGGAWSLFADVLVHNDTADSFKIPAALQFSVKGQDGLNYAATVLSGGDQTVLPHQTGLIAIQAPVGSAEGFAGFTLQLLKKAAAASASGNAGGSGSGSTAAPAASATTAGTTALASVSFAGTLTTSVPGESVKYAPRAANSIGMTVDSMKADAKSDGIHADSEFTLRNDTTAVLAVPALGAMYQIPQSTLSVPAVDTGVHPALLAPGESTTYHYTGTLPNGVDSASAELVILEKKPGAVSANSPILVTPLAGASVTGTGTGSSADNSAGVLTTAGRLGLAVSNVYRLATESADDQIMAEVTVQNLENKIIQLPAMYGGFKTDDLDLPGKAVRIQSSPYLNPGQKTTIYLYSKISYDVAFDSGTFYIGSGTLDAKTAAVTPDRKWAELPVTVSQDGIRKADYNQDWFIRDAGRMSTAKVVDSQIYKSGDQQVVALRIEQKNQEARSGAPVSYSGYITDESGNIYSAKVEEDTSKLCKDCSAMSTLWATLPGNLPTDKLSVVFGQKIDDQSFAYAQKIAFKPTGEQTAPKGNDLTVHLAPYTIRMANFLYLYGTKKIDYTFDYTVDKGSNAVGADKNRVLMFELVDENGKVDKTWDVPLSGTGELTSGVKNKLTLDTTTVTDLYLLYFHPAINVYEKFEGATRLLGVIDFSITGN